MIMAKRFIYFFLFVFIINVFAVASVGDWHIHGVFGNSPKKVIDTGKKVYFLVDKWLYYYDKEEQETVSLSESGDMNDVIINDIYYDYDKKRVYVAYANSNIDVIYENGDIINIPDIYNASLSTTKTINHIAFSKYGVYVATDFGYVCLNDEKNEVKESRVYNTKIISLCVVGDKLVFSDNNQLYIEDIGKHYNSISEVTATSFKQDGKISAIDDNYFFFDRGWLYKFKVNDNDVVYSGIISQTGVNNLQPTPTGFQYNDNNGVLYRLDETGGVVSSINMPESMHQSCFSSYEADGSLWELNVNGLRHVELTESGAETVLMDFARPNASTVSLPYYLEYNKGLNKLYVMNTASTRYISDYLSRAVLSSYDGISWKNEMPENAPTLNKQGNNNNHINAPYSLVFDPEDPNTCYIGTWFEGVYKLTNGEVVAKYDWTNSAIDKVEIDANFHICTTPCIRFDKNMNMWVTQSQNEKNYITVLPRAKQSKENLSREDWISPKIQGLTESFRGHFLITSRDIKIHNNGAYAGPLVIFYDDGNPASSNIVSKTFSSLIDQDGKEFTWNYINCFAEDKNGRVWMGTSGGVVSFFPQNALLSDNFTINHIKVPRNDGTNLADYLLDNTDVTCIEVDGSNRKWIGTSKSGVLLVSEDGSEILEQFTIDNSPLLSNCVYSVRCNPINNKVYIGTDKGLLEFSSDSEPPAESYSEIYAFPNPVRPEYTGEITIRGLMENSLVKISDSDGNIIKSIRSTGGMTTWDGCNSQGEPVKSGVYFVFASQNENNSSSGAVTKILIIR